MFFEKIIYNKNMEIKFQMIWKEVYVPEYSKTFYMLFIQEEGQEESSALGSIVESSTDEGSYVWALRGGIPNRVAASLRKAMMDCQSCIKEEYLDKGMVPWRVNIVSQN